MNKWFYFSIFLVGVLALFVLFAPFDSAVKIPLKQEVTLKNSINKTQKKLPPMKIIKPIINKNRPNPKTTTIKPIVKNRYNITKEIKKPHIVNSERNFLHINKNIIENRKISRNKLAPKDNFIDIGNGLKMRIKPVEKDMDNTLQTSSSDRLSPPAIPIILSGTIDYDKKFSISIPPKMASQGSVTLQLKDKNGIKDIEVLIPTDVKSGSIIKVDNSIDSTKKEQVVQSSQDDTQNEGSIAPPMPPSLSQ